MNSVRHTWRTALIAVSSLGFLGVPEGCGPPRTAAVLRYAAQPILDEHELADEEVVAAVNNKLQAGGSAIGRAELLAERTDDDRLVLEVQAFGSREEDIQAVKQRLADQTLEFRVLAHPEDPNHADIIEAALALDEPLDAKAIIREGDGAARWTIGSTDELRNPPLVTRSVTTEDGEDVTYALVLMQESDVTGNAVQAAKREVTKSGQPAILVRFSPHGAARISRLTSQNLPDTATGRPKRLAIILNGRIVAAPAIRSQITDQAIIEGPFTEAEANAIATALDGGTLPVKLELIDRRSP